MYDPTKPSTNSVLELIKTTWDTSNLKVWANTYSLFEKKFNYPEVDHTDGIGTKGIYHWKKKTFRNATLDALAMNLNDLLLVRATAYKLQNHLVLPRDDNDAIREIMGTLVAECKKRKIAVTGGETSIHNVKNSFDIGITMSGFVKTSMQNKAEIGDVVVGLKSNGIHSNGFTLVRKLFKKEFRSEFIRPTKIYYDDLLPLLKNFEIHGMMHITGGAFSKLQGIIDKNQDIVISSPIKPQNIFFDIYKKNIPDKQMLTTFNCGTGFVLTMPENDAKKFLKKINYSQIIGRVTEGNGRITLVSPFNKQTITL